MPKVLVTESYLEDIAEAIRTKTGGSDTYTPAEMAQAIEDIPLGGGYTVDEISQGSPSGAVVLSNDITNIGEYGMAGRNMTSFSSSLTSAGSRAFSSCKNLTSISLPNLTKINSYLFDGCSNLNSISIPNADRIDGPRPFNGCTQLLSINLPKVKTKLNSADNIFTGSSALVIVLPAFTSWSFNGFVNAPVKTLDLGLNVTTLQGNVFSSATAMNTLIIRKTSGVPTMNNINAFNATPFASGKAGGTLYVPSDLISSYQSATNWSTILGYANNSIQAIEGSQYENYYADGTPIS